MVRGVNLAANQDAGVAPAWHSGAHGQYEIATGGHGENALTEDERKQRETGCSPGKKIIADALRGKQEQTLKDYLEGQATLDEKVILNTIRLIMSTPEYQLT